MKEKLPKTYFLAENERLNDYLYILQCIKKIPNTSIALAAENELYHLRQEGIPIPVDSFIGDDTPDIPITTSISNAKNIPMLTGHVPIERAGELAAKFSLILSYDPVATTSLQVEFYKNQDLELGIRLSVKKTVNLSSLLGMLQGPKEETDTLTTWNQLIQDTANEGAKFFDEEDVASSPMDEVFTEIEETLPLIQNKKIREEAQAALNNYKLRKIPLNTIQHPKGNCYAEVVNGYVGLFSTIRDDASLQKFCRRASELLRFVTSSFDIYFMTAFNDIFIVFKTDYSAMMHTLLLRYGAENIEKYPGVEGDPQVSNNKQVTTQEINPDTRIIGNLRSNKKQIDSPYSTGPLNRPKKPVYKETPEERRERIREEEEEKDPQYGPKPDPNFDKWILNNMNIKEAKALLHWFRSL